MDISGITSQLSTPNSVQGSIGVAVLKKAIDADASTTLSLINSAASPAPSSSSTNLPPNLGQNVNTTA